MSDAFTEHEEIAALLGAYALDAVDGAEGELVRAHVETCPRCRAELEACRAAAASLATHRVPAPPHLWTRIAQELNRTPPAASLDLPAPPLGRLEVVPQRPGSAPDDRGDGASAKGDARSVQRRRQPRRRAALAAAAAALVLVGGIGFAGAQLEAKIDSPSGTPNGSADGASPGALLANPNHQVTALRTPQGQVVAQATTLDGHGYLVSQGMAALPASESYQLWGLIQGQPVSLGLLGPAPRTVAFSYGASRPSVIMVTVEPAGGVTTPDRAPLAQGPLN